MTTITKERLLTIKQWRETYGPGSNVVLPAEEAEELARIALASLEVEPVSQTYKLTFEQWLEQQHDKIDVDCGCVSTEMLMHWIRVAYEAGNYPVTQDGWISCSERMPDTKTAVLVAVEFDRKGDWRMKWATYIPGHPDANDGWIIPGASWKPSHWMRLPEPPQEMK
ncbi:hypothetical protein VEGS09_16820 [Escherichia coli]|uniref:DUF551 domain-containing protein n=1 Tax=Escherichia coli TaxID=562 RepID=UPI0013992E01|nr:DUF551 domain-containing protein [Escherichia coli]BBP29981.1 hypothetical protein VEGS09_16820 [Escherichia coli]BEC09504.1 hypothetical protein VEE66_16740 [Escherichia coli]